MAFNQQVFRQRALTAVVFAAAMLGGVFGGETSFLALFSVIGVGCLWELQSLLQTDGALLFLRKIAAVAVGLAAPIFCCMLDDHRWIWVVGFFIFGTLSLFILELFAKSERPFSNVGAALVGFIYVGIPLAALRFLAFKYDATDAAFLPNEYAAFRVFGLLLLTWSNDTFAYLVGSFIGKTPFFPRISPKKTWEGTIGGALLTVGLGWVLFKILGEWSLAQWLVLAVVVAIFGTLGDLVESLLKRSVGVKDSGSLLPGHGGLLDRFDAFLFMLPWAFFALEFVR